MTKVVVFCFISLFVCTLTFASMNDSSFILPAYSQKISLDFKGADIRDVLKVFSKQIGSNFILDKDVPNIQITVLLNEVPVEEALKKILSVNALDYTYDETLNIFVVKQRSSVDKKLVTRVYQLHYASVDSSKMNSLSGSSSSAGVGGSAATSTGSSSSLKATVSVVLTGKGKVLDDPRTNSLIITDEEDNFPQIEALIAKLDVPLKQVLIEVEMLDVTKSTSDQMGAKFSLGGTITGAGLAQNHYFPFRSDNIYEKYVDSGDKTTVTASGGITSSSESTVFPKTYTSGTMDFSQTQLMLKFLKSQTDTKSLARPRIITPDNETAVIQIAANEAIGVKVVTTGSTNSVQSKEPERALVGTYLQVTPQINAMTNEITLTIDPKVVQNVKNNIDGTEFGNAEERSVHVKLRVPDGETVVIGGLLRNDNSKTIDKVPFLSAIPVIGRAFTYKSSAGSNRELMIFLTPHILDNDLSVDRTLNKDKQKNAQIREQLLQDSRSSIIDQEMDKINPALLRK